MQLQWLVRDAHYSINPGPHSGIHRAQANPLSFNAHLLARGTLPQSLEQRQLKKKEKRRYCKCSSSPAAREFKLHMGSEPVSNVIPSERPDIVTVSGRDDTVAFNITGSMPRKSPRGGCGTVLG
jgi:hypothetical protein